jgi:hypothetical protein
MAGGAEGDTMSARAWRTAGEVELVVDGDPALVYALVSDVTRVGERSPECRSAEWDSGEPGTVGATFRGRNRVGRLARWSRRCEVVRAEPGVAFAFRTLPERWDVTRQDSTVWAYQLEELAHGTRVTHSYEITRLPHLPLRWLYGRLLPDHRDMRPQMAYNLAALATQVARPLPS